MADTIFAREERYVVLKKADIQASLNAMQQEMLHNIMEKVAEGRLSRGKKPLSCVVVEDDWPESPIIWSMIEARMTGGVNFVDWQAARISDLEARLAVYEKGEDHEV